MPPHIVRNVRLLYSATRKVVDSQSNAASDSIVIERVDWRVRVVDDILVPLRGSIVKQTMRRRRRSEGNENRGWLLANALSQVGNEALVTSV